MPYSPEHKEKTRKRIVEAARILFNRYGFNGVTIEMVMEEAGLTRGGFYNHFENKEALFAAAVRGFLMGRGAQWREEAGIDMAGLSPQMAQQMLESYLGTKHLGDLEGQCPMIALPSDVARASADVQEAYQELLSAMVWLFEESVGSRQKALSMAALCIGGMVLARTLPSSELGQEVREAALEAARAV